MRYSKQQSQTYKDEIKRIRRHLRQHGFVLKLRKRKLSWNRIKEGSYGFDYCGGVFFNTDKKIIVYFHDKCPKWLILQVILHEYRHFLHLTNKLYQDYYKYDELIRIDDYRKSKTLPNLLTGIRAEHDCESYSINRMKYLDLYTGAKWDYQFCQTFAYKIHQEFFLKYKREYKKRVKNKAIIKHFEKEFAA